MEGLFAEKRTSETTAAAAAPGGSFMALEACVEEGMVLMEEEVRARRTIGALVTYLPVPK